MNCLSEMPHKRILNKVNFQTSVVKKRCLLSLLLLLRPYNWVIWRQAWGEGSKCLLQEGKGRENEFCAPWLEEPVGAAAEGWGGAVLRNGRNGSEPYEDRRHVHFYWGAFKQSHVGTPKKKKACNQCLKPMLFPLSCCMLFFLVKKKAIKENKADPCSHLFAFLTGSQKWFIVWKSRVWFWRK